MMLSRRFRILLSISALTLTGALIAIRIAPLTSYHLSIYTETPLMYWLGIIIATISASVVGMRSASAIARTIALALTTTASSILAATPFFRGYFFYGYYDPLPHFGIVRDILKETWIATDQIYPSLHLLAATTVKITELTIGDSLMLLVGIFAAIFILGTVISARQFGVDGTGTLIAALSGSLFLVLNPIRLPQLIPSPTVMGVLFWPLAVGGLLITLTHRDSASRGVLIVLTLGLSFLHPQHGLTFLIVAFAVSIFIQLRELELFIPNLKEGARSIILPLLIGSMVLAIWLSAIPGFGGSLGVVIRAIEGTGSATIGSAIASGVFDTTGGGILPIFIRTFLIRAIVAIFVVGVLLSIAIKLLRKDEPPLHPLLLWLGAAFVPVLGFAAIYVGTGKIGQTTRYLAIPFVFGTILLAVALAKLPQQLSKRDNNSVVSVAVVIILLVAFVVNVPALFRSPYIFQENQQVTKSTWEGYKTTFETTDGPYLRVDSTPLRYRTAIYGRRVSTEGLGMEPAAGLRSQTPTRRLPGSSPTHFANQSLPTVVPQPTYLVVTARARKAEAVLYQGATFSEADFRYLDQDHHISHVIDTGDYDLYRITPQ